MKTSKKTRTKGKAKTVSKGRKRTTADGSPVIYHDVYHNAADSFSTFRNRAVAVVQTKSGETFQVPYDTKTGKVPTYAIVERLLDEDEGGRKGRKRSVIRDVSQDAVTVHEIPKGGFTPEQIVATGWWAHPSESDIKGIDDTTGAIVRPFDGVSKRHRTSTVGIAIMAPEEERKRIQKVLTDNFTGAELKRAAEGGLVITSMNPGKNYGGLYWPRQSGIDTSHITLKPGCSEDTITHEFVHHLRFVDESRKGLARTPQPKDQDGKLSDTYRFMKPAQRGAISNLEEAATVAEAAGRTREDNPPSGYYWYIPDNDTSPRDSYAHDRGLMTKGKPKRGKNATKALESGFMDTKISGLRKYSGKSAKTSAQDFLRALESEPASSKNRRSRR